MTLNSTPSRPLQKIKARDSRYLRRQNVGKDLATLLVARANARCDGGYEVMTPLGEVLLRKGQIRKYQLDFLLGLQNAHRGNPFEFKLGELLVKHRVVSPDILQEALRVQSEVPFESVTDVLKNYENQVSRLTVLVPSPSE